MALDVMIDTMNLLFKQRVHSKLLLETKTKLSYVTLISTFL